MTEFRVNDDVEAFGVRGRVTEILLDNHYPVKVKFDSPNTADSFTLDGRRNDWHLTPSLKLIERPKSKKLVPHWPAICLKEGAVALSDYLYPDIKTATKYEISVIRLATEYPAAMIEVEE